MSEPARGEIDAVPADAPHAAAGSRLDRWWLGVRNSSLLGGRLRLDTIWRWGVPIAVTGLAAALRLWDLGEPGTLVFDETYYVKDAWSLVHLGWEARWPDGADASFEAGDTDGWLSDPSFVVHPPLGKWLIGSGMLLGGVENSYSWRLASAVAGIIAVLLVFLLARRLFSSTLVAGIGALLLAVDGNAIAMSRLGLLDNLVMLFALLGFGAILLDRGWHERRLSGRLDHARILGRTPDWGPAIWWRPWLVAAGTAFGLTAAVKWSGLYFLAAFGLYIVVVDALLRRRLDLPFWASAAALKQGPLSFVLLVFPAVGAYLATWSGWFVTRGGYDRQWANQPGNAWTGSLAWVPHSVQSFLQFQSAAYDFHIGLDRAHSVMAPAWSWLPLLRPSVVYTVSFEQGQAGCTAEQCVRTITTLPNPVVWWAAVIACLYLVYRLVRYRDWRHGLILMGLVGGYLPWLLYPARTTFFFYTIAFEPYLILGLTAVIAIIVGRPSDPAPLRQSGLWVVGIFVVFALAISAFWYPLSTGHVVSLQFWQLHQWLPGWYTDIFSPPATATAT